MAKKTQKKTAGRKPRARKEGQETLLEQRDRYNKMVPGAQKLGIACQVVGLGADKKKYPNGTTFASRAHGERAIATLEKKIREAKK